MIHASQKKRLLQVSFACAWCLAGCATLDATTAPALTKAAAIPARAAAAGITIGKSTKADVIAAFGKTTVINFDSGFEVWVYYLTGDVPARAGSGKAEFLVLFAPSGVVAKTRIRPDPMPLAGG